MKGWSDHLVLSGNQDRPSHQTREIFIIKFPLLSMSAGFSLVGR